MEAWRTLILQPDDLFRYVLVPSGSPGTPHTPPHTTDVLAFLIIVVTARRLRRDRYPGMPTVVDNIVQESTRYFVFIFLVQLVAQLFVFFAPVGDA